MIRFLEVENFGVLQGMYELGAMTTLTGRNGSGKTAIGRAILFLYTGRDGSGSQTTDHLIRDRSETMSVRGTMQDGVTVERRQTPSGQKQIKVNGSVMSQEQFEKVMPVDWQVFASVFMVGFFEKLPELDQRALMLRITPQIDRDVLFSKMTGGASAGVVIDWSKPTKKLYDEWNKKRIEVGKQLSELEGRRNLLVEQLAVIEVPEKLDEQSHKDEIAKIDAEIRAEQTKIQVHANWATRSDAAKKQKEQFDMSAQVNVEVEEKRASLKKQLDEVSVAVVRPEEFARLKGEHKGLVELQREKMGQLRLVENDLLGVPDLAASFKDSCPTCKRKLSETAVKAARETVDAATEKRTVLAEKMNQMATEVRNVTELATAVDRKVWKIEADILEQENKNRKKASEIQNEMSKLKTLFVTAPDEVGPEPENGSTEAVSELDRKRRMSLTELEKAKHQNGIHSAQKKRKDDLEATRSENEARGMAKAAEQLASDVIAEALHPVRGIDGEMLKLKMAAVEVPGVNIALTETLKNGEQSDCFKISAGGIPYPSLSSGERINVSMKVADAIDKLVENKVNSRFIDDADLVDDLKLPTVGQLFIARVAKEKALEIVRQ